MNRGYSEEEVNFSNWAPILTSDWNLKDYEKFKLRKQAVELLLGTEIPINEIVKLTGIRKNELYRFVDRCLSRDSEGKFFGYQGLIPNLKIESYKRKFQNNSIDNDSNYSGSFKLLLSEYPMLKEFLIDEYFKASSKKNSARELKINYKNIHRKFIAECRKCGIKSTEYPFNTASLASKSVINFLKDISTNYYKEVAKNNGGQASMLLNNTNNTVNSSTNILRPLERVEFDGHRIDAIFTLEFTTPGGEKITSELNRIWILTLVDVATRCVIGYHLCLRREYNSDDVKKCFQSAIIPWKPKKIIIPGLNYQPDAGFPSYMFSEAEYAIWDELCYDNAKSHLSYEVKDILQKYIGCSINMGPVAVPVRRPIIERFFRTLEQNSFHRLPSTTGSNPLDPKRKDAEKNALKFAISYEHIEELCEVVIGNYNATPHEGNMGFTPLEIFESRLEQGYTLNQLPVERRNEVNLFPLVTTRVVNGNINTGRRPYITFKQSRYSSPELNNDFSMVNEKIKILINTEDLRTVEAYRNDGTRYGILTAAGQWGITPHTLRFKDAINKFKRERYFSYTEHDDPMDKFQEFLEAQAINNKALRSLLAEIKSYKKKYHVDTIRAETAQKVKIINDNHSELQDLVIEQQKKSLQFNDNKEIDTIDVHKTIINQKLQEKELLKNQVTEDTPEILLINSTDISSSDEQKLHSDSHINDLEAAYFEKMIEAGRSARTKKRRSINL